MHLGMVMLCGQIGGFSQAGWTGLLCIGHEKLEERCMPGKKKRGKPWKLFCVVETVGC